MNNRLLRYVIRSIETRSPSFFSTVFRENSRVLVRRLHARINFTLLHLRFPPSSRFVISISPFFFLFFFHHSQPPCFPFLAGFEKITRSIFSKPSKSHKGTNPRSSDETEGRRGRGRGREIPRSTRYFSSPIYFARALHALHTHIINTRSCATSPRIGRHQWRDDTEKRKYK